VHLCPSLLGFGAWDHVCSLRLKPFRRMQVPCLGLQIYYVSVYSKFSGVLSLMIQICFFSCGKGQVMLMMIPVTFFWVAVYSEIPVLRVLMLQDKRLIPYGSCRY